MNLILESQNPKDYLGEIPPVILFSTPLISAQIKEIKKQAATPLARARLAFQVARDKIGHSFDTQKQIVTINAEDVLQNCDGICFAKAHLLAALLRGMDIPTGFCYQRVLRKGTIESGYALHGLNAVYLREAGWFRLDPRGNKPGIDSEFTTDHEQLAYTLHPDLGEIDYPNVFIRPLDSVITSMKASKDVQELFFKRPEALTV